MSGRPVTLAAVVEKLKAPTGRGGYRLSREEAQLVLLHLRARSLTPVERELVKRRVADLREQQRGQQRDHERALERHAA